MDVTDIMPAFTYVVQAQEEAQQSRAEREPAEDLARTPAEAIKPEILSMYGAAATDPGVYDVMIVNFPGVRDAASWVAASGLDQATVQLRDMDGWGPCMVQVTGGVHSTAKTDPAPRRGFTIEQAHRALAQVGSELQAAAGAGRLDFLFQDEPQGLTVALNTEASHYQAEREGEVVAFARWSNNVLRVFLPRGTFIGRMYRSDGRIIAGEAVSTYRASTGSEPLQHYAGECEVARGASMADPFQALLTATAEHFQPSVRPQSATTLAKAPEAEEFTIAGVPACGAPVDGGRCGRRPHHDGGPHIMEPGTEVRGEYYVMPHGFTAPANRPLARFHYVGLEAGDAFDQALEWAREYARKYGKTYDLWHADPEPIFIVQVTADGQLIWPRR